MGSMTLGSEVKMSIAWHGVYRRIRDEMELHDTYICSMSSSPVLSGLRFSQSVPMFSFRYASITHVFTSSRDEVVEYRCTDSRSHDRGK
jgi:hypothetical protein